MLYMMVETLDGRFGEMVPGNRTGDWSWQAHWLVHQSVTVIAYHIVDPTIKLWRRIPTVYRCLCPGDEFDLVWRVDTLDFSKPGDNVIVRF